MLTLEPNLDQLDLKLKAVWIKEIDVQLDEWFCFGDILALKIALDDCD